MQIPQIPKPNACKGQRTHYYVMRLKFKDIKLKKKRSGVVVVDAHPVLPILTKVRRTPILFMWHNISYEFFFVQYKIGTLSIN